MISPFSRLEIVRNCNHGAQSISAIELAAPEFVVGAGVLRNYLVLHIGNVSIKLMSESLS